VAVLATPDNVDSQYVILSGAVNVSDDRNDEERRGKPESEEDNKENHRRTSHVVTHHWTDLVMVLTA
jgi:hypothetical protein